MAKKRFLVAVADRRTIYLDKEIEAANENEARELAEAEEWTAENGWTERYENMFTESGIESVEEISPEEAE